MRSLDSLKKADVLFQIIETKDYAVSLCTKSHCIDCQFMRLFDFAFVPNYPEPLDRLMRLASSEYWGRGGRMLKSYFNHMFDKVMDDGLMAYSNDGEVAVFNTGLQTTDLEMIYAVFVKNERDDAQDWFFRGFTTAKAPGIGDLLVDFDELPDRPRFIHHTEQAFFALTAGPPECDWQRMIPENISRIPKHALELASEGRIHLPDIRDVGKESYISSLEDFKESLMDDPGFDTLSTWLEEAMEGAMDQLSLDYKYAVPSWHAKDRFVALMLPIRLQSREVNAAIAVVWDEKKKYYTGVNILTLEMAYNNARLIARPEARWIVEGNNAHNRF